MKKNTIICIIAGVVVLDTGHLGRAQTPPADSTQTTTANLPTEPQVKQQQSPDTNSTLSASNSPAGMQELLSDKVIVKAKGFEIKQSDLDKVLTGARANAAKQGQTLPSEFPVAILNQLITIQMLLQDTTPADRTAGAIEADLQYTNLLKRFGSTEAFERQLEAVGMTMDELRAKALQEAVAKATLKRGLNIAVTEDEAMAFYAKHITEFAQAGTESLPAKQFAYTDTLPNINKTVAEICRSEVEANKIKELAPDYVKKLRSEQQVEITDPALKALDESVRAQAESAVASPAK